MFTGFSGHVAEVLNSIVQFKEPILLTNNFIQNTLVVVGGEGGVVFPFSDMWGYIWGPCRNKQTHHDA